MTTGVEFATDTLYPTSGGGDGATQEKDTVVEFICSTLRSLGASVTVNDMMASHHASSVYWSANHVWL